MAIDAVSDNLYNIQTEADLLSLPNFDRPFYVLGEGSNTLFVEKQAPLLIRPLIKGIDVVESDDCFTLTVGAGESWHELVCFTVGNNMPGLENLALIPGSVGAAPVQNIGAYGVEFSKFCFAVNYFCLTQKVMKTLLASECQFAYRESIFKQALKNKVIITSVTLKLPKQWTPEIKYSGLDKLSVEVSAKDVMERVIEIRSSKLPDPAKLANTGSFFKNPVVGLGVFNGLKAKYAEMPYYPQTDGRVKLAAGWLIEQAGLKGVRQGDAAVHNKQALVLVNHGMATGEDILALAQTVIHAVNEKFAVTLTPEVRLVTSGGERTISELGSNV